MKGHKNRYSKWNFQSPPTPRHQKGKPVLYSMDSNTPYFGYYKEQRKQEISKIKSLQRDSSADFIDKINSDAENIGDSNENAIIPRIKVRYKQFYPTFITKLCYLSID